MARLLLSVIALAPALLLHAAHSAACLPDSRQVFFSSGSAELDQTARSILEEGVSSQQSLQRTSRILVTGHTDRVGDATLNLRLGQRRAEAVRDYLMALGLPASRIVIRSYGEAKPLVATADEVPERSNRFVQYQEIPAVEAGGAVGKATGDPTVC